MTIQRVLLPLLILWPTLALADLRETIRDYQTEIAALEAAHDEWLDYEPARATMKQAFIDNGIGFSMRYAEDWGGWLYLDWDNVQSLYTRARTASAGRAAPLVIGHDPHSSLGVRNPTSEVSA